MNATRGNASAHRGRAILEYYPVPPMGRASRGEARLRRVTWIIFPSAGCCVSTVAYPPSKDERIR